MKNLLDAQDNQKMTHRISKLLADQKRHFGTMSVEEMLYHSNSVSQAILTSGSAQRPGLKQTFLRILVLNLMQKMPMGRHSSKKYFSRQEELKFDIEKNRLIQLTNDFLAHKKQLAGEHPVFGRLTNRQWGRFAWIHLDHHLRQFGV